MKLRTVYLIIFCVILISLCIILYSSFSNIAVHTSEELDSTPRFIIDAGHGGEDGGAQAADVLEKDINLQIAHKLAFVLKCHGYDVTEVRTEDVSVYSDDADNLRNKKVSDLNNRVELFNSSEDNIVVSIHQNMFENSVYSGAQIFYSVNHSGSEPLAEAIRASIVEKVQPENTRDIVPAGSNIYVLDHTTVPAVIVECGFLSNTEEREKLIDDAYQNEMVLAIADGVITYCKTKNNI